MISRSLTGVSLALLSALAVSSLGQATDPLGVLGGLAGAAAAATGANSGNPVLGGSMLGSVGRTGGLLGPLSGAAQSLVNAGAGAAAGATSALTGGDAGLIGNGMRLVQGIAGGVASAMNTGMNEIGRSLGLGDAAMATGSPAGPLGVLGANQVARNIGHSAAAAAGAASEMLAPTNPMTSAMGAAAATSAALAGAAAPVAAAIDVATSGAAAAGNPLAAANSMAASNAAAAAAAGSAAAAESAAASSPIIGRQALALEAIRNAQAESALAGSEMAAHGANNARSAALASNAYRQAKLASARDRVNIAGTIQNSARISDAAIATHDAATKAEDSLLGSELAVDSAATVLDSDGAYIPPVTSSLLRSLPYGRLGLRNIIPRPLTHAVPGLPDVWLNGYPVSYNNVPLKMWPPALGSSFVPGSFPFFGPFGLLPAPIGAFLNQPFTSNNGLVLNGMVFDPAYAYLTTNLNGIVSTSELPILANGQLEAQDELAVANLLQMQQLNGLGMSTTYQGYGRLNPVPMITGSVTDANLMPTTTIGTTYPIGSTLVIEPRDSFFQDYNDNASSRQNFDERQQP